MEAKKVFNNNIGILNRGIFYYHVYESMASDKILAQDKIAQVPNSKPELTLLII